MDAVETDLFPYQAVAQISASHPLVLAPHPDDEIFGCGGAIASHVLQGIPVDVVILTDGGLYGDPSIRMAESRAAAALLGYGEPEFWGLPDRGLHQAQDLVERIVKKIGITGADLVYAPSPWEIHPDHRRTCSAAVEAVIRTGIRIAFYEVGNPLRPNLLLDITAHVDTKKEAMLCFASQLAQQDYGRHIAALNLYRTYTLSREVAAAEAYLLFSAAELRDTLPGLLAAEPVTLGASPSVLAAGASRPLVSILIRSVDRQYLQEALDSVALQTYPSIEVVVVAAQPGHRPLPPHCGPFEMRLVTTDVALHRGQAANKALSQARGEFLLFLDDDDWLLPGHIARLAHVLEHQPATLAAYTGVALTGPQGESLGQVLDLPFDRIRQLAGNLTPIHAVLFSRRLLDRGCHFDETLQLHEDWDFWLQVARHTVFAHVPGVSAFYRTHQSSGVNIDSESTQSSIRAIFAKWQPLWEPGQTEALMQRVRSHDDLELQLSVQKNTLDGAQQAVDLQRQTIHQQAVTMEQYRHQAEHRTHVMLAQEQEMVKRLTQEAEAREQATVQRLTQEAEAREQATVQRLTQEAEVREQATVQRLTQKAEVREQLVNEHHRREIESRDQATANGASIISQLKNSTSWKLTAPLRWLSAKLKLRG